MNYAIIDGTTVKNTGTIQKLFPNTSFSIAGPNADFLTANNVVELVENLSFTTPTQKLSIVDAYVDSGKAYSESRINNFRRTDYSYKSTMVEYKVTKR